MVTSPSAHLAVFLVALSSTFALGQTPATSGSGSGGFSIRSDELNRDYTIRINAPEKAGDALLPSIYVLDGQWEFEMTSAIHGALRQDGFVSDAVLIGVCIPGSDEERRSVRSQDFAPKTSIGDGKALLFRKFLFDSVVPEVEKRHSCDKSNRTLVGWSMGGMFAIETMLSTPDSFNNYVAISPALFWDKGHASVRLRDSDFQKPGQPVSLWMSIGEFEPPYFQDAFRQFERNLTNVQLPNLQLRVLSLEKERHFSGRSVAYATAFKELLGPKPVELSENELKKVCGTYRPVQNEWAWWGDVEIGLSEGRLWASRNFSGFEGRDALIPVSKQSFVGTRYGSRFSIIDESDETSIELKWEEFPPIRLELVNPK